MSSTHGPEEHNFPAEETIQTREQIERDISECWAMIHQFRARANNLMRAHDAHRHPALVEEARLWRKREWVYDARLSRDHDKLARIKLLGLSPADRAEYVGDEQEGRPA